MKLLACLIAWCLFFTFSAKAADVGIRVYGGSLKEEFAGDSFATTTIYGLSVVFDFNTGYFTLIHIDRHAKSVSTETFFGTADFIQPGTPEATAKARLIVIANAANGSYPVRTYRFRSPSRPKLVPVASSTSSLVASTLGFLFDVWAPAAYFYEDTGSISDQKTITILCNDKGDDLATATSRVLADLKARKIIN